MAYLVGTPSRNLVITIATSSLSRSLAPNLDHHGGLLRDALRFTSSEARAARAAFLYSHTMHHHRIHHRLFSQIPARHGPARYVSKVHCGGMRTNSSSSSSQLSSQLNPPSPQPTGPTPSPTRLICGDPFTDNPTEDAARQRILQRLAETNPLFQPTMRQTSFEATIHWLQDNFPEETSRSKTVAGSLPWWQHRGHQAPRPFFQYSHAGPFPKTISYATDDGGADRAPMTTIPWDDTRLVFVGRSGGPTTRASGIKQGGTVCVAITVLPPAGLGEGETAAALRAAETALLAFLREAQDVGYLGSPPMGPDLEGCLAFVFLGRDVSVSEYSKKRGLFDPPGGFEFEHKRVDPAPLPPLPGTEEYERWRRTNWS